MGPSGPPCRMASPMSTSACAARNLIWGLVAATPLVGCGDEDLIGPGDPGPQPQTEARVLALGTYAAPVGSMIEVYGQGFPAPREGRVRLHFAGTFTPSEGAPQPVDLETPARWVDASTLRWTSFGPYQNPFSTDGSAVGTFEGTVGARVLAPDGSTQRSAAAPLDVRFEVEPSILVHELQPITASCAGGVTRALGGAPYRMQVEAVGFEPMTFTYTISAPGLSLPDVSIRHLATTHDDVIGTDGTLRFPPVPEGRASYSALLTVSARDREGRVRSSSFAIDVHRPIEVFYNGNVQVAEVLAPEPVSACIPGGVNGRNVSYSESQAESRARSYSMNWNESWLSSHTVSQGSSETIGLSETNGVGFSTTDGESFNWSLGTDVSGKIGFDKLVEVGVGTSASQGGATNQSETNTQNRSQGVNESSTTTETESVGRSNGGSQGQAFAWSVSSSEVISRSFGGHVIAGTYGVFYRQTLRLIRRAAVVAYNQCGNAKVVGELDFTDWTWSPDLALGNACPPLPTSNLPSARCDVEPCTGR